MRRLALVIGGLIAAGVALADFVPAVRADDSAPAAPVTPATVKRGEYLAHAADCAACHMGTDKKLSGGRAFTTPFGRIYASNITPDKTQGVGDYTDDEWVAALQRGVGRGGKHLYPAMPYTNYTLMSREDALAIKAYILSQPGSAAATPPNSLSFPFDIRFLMVFWNVLNNPDKRFVPDTTHDAVWNRGAYLAEALGHCQQCHTPRNFMQGLKTSQAYAGARAAGLEGVQHYQRCEIRYWRLVRAGPGDLSDNGPCHRPWCCQRADGGGGWIFAALFDARRCSRAGKLCKIHSGHYHGNRRVCDADCRE